MNIDKGTNSISTNHGRDFAAKLANHIVSLALYQARHALPPLPDPVVVTVTAHGNWALSSIEGLSRGPVTLVKAIPAVESEFDGSLRATANALMHLTPQKSQKLLQALHEHVAGIANAEADPEYPNYSPGAEARLLPDRLPIIIRTCDPRVIDALVIFREEAGRVHSSGAIGNLLKRLPQFNIDYELVKADAPSLLHFARYVKGNDLCSSGIHFIQSEGVGARPEEMYQNPTEGDASQCLHLVHSAVTDEGAPDVVCISAPALTREVRNVA